MDYIFCDFNSTDFKISFFSPCKRVGALILGIHPLALYNPALSMSLFPTLPLGQFIRIPSHLLPPDFGHHRVHDVDGGGGLVGHGHLVKGKGVVAAGEVSPLGGVNLGGTESSF